MEWVERGPANVGGRTRGLIVDPDDPNKNTWYAGSVGGGVWKTIDAGATWTLLTTDVPNLATSVLAMAPSNPDVIYVGTGEGFFNADAIGGDGIFKTTDRGQTWTQLASTSGNSNFTAVNRIVVDPANENIAVAATNTGVFKTTDGGATWEKKYTTSSRVLDLRANPLNFNTLYGTVYGTGTTGSFDGGAIKSTDAGETWTEYFTELNGGRFEIAIAPTDTNRLYISAESSPSALYMSLDAGLTWTQVAELGGSAANWLGAQGWYDNTIEVHPYNEDIAFVGGIDLWRAEVNIDSTKDIIDADTVGTGSFLSFRPTPDFEFLGGGVGTGEVYFDEELLNGEEYVNVEIRFGPGKSQRAHRFTLNTYQYEDYVDVPFEVWDVDNNRQLMVSFQDLLKNGEYNVSITVGDVIFVHSLEYDADNPDPNIAVDEGVKYQNLYVVTAVNASGVSWNPDNHPDSYISITQGYVPDLYKTITAISDGYGQYPTNEYVHVDHHNIVMIPVDEQTNSFRILNANDGGVAISDDGGQTWTEVGDNGYNTTQFYGMDKAPGVDRYAGGTQDNGTWMSPAGEDAVKTTDYNFIISGDGFEVSWHYQDINKIIGGSQFNRFFRTTDGTNFFAANDGFDDWGTSNSPFISKIAKSQADPDLLFTISRQGVWRTDNFAENWTLTPINNNFQSGGFFTFAQVDISIADPQVVWAGAYMTTGDRIHVSKDGGLTFSVTNSWGNLGNVSGLNTHPTDPATAYLTFSINNAPKILRTTDYGNSWQDITGYQNGGPSSNGFPNVATYSVLVMPYNTDIIWAGTDIGIVESTDGGATWALADNGLPAVSIWDMRIVDDQVVVGTHGRGVWSVTLPELTGYGPPEVTLAPRINGKVISSPAGVTVNASLRSPYDSTRVKAGNNILAAVYNNQTSIDTAIVLWNLTKKAAYINPAVKL